AVFDIGRPLVVEGVFDAGAERPAETLDVELAVAAGVRRGIESRQGHVDEIARGVIGRDALQAPIKVLDVVAAVHHAAGEVIERSAVGVAGARAEAPAEIVLDVGLEGSAGRERGSVLGGKRAAERGAEAVIKRLAGVLAAVGHVELAAENEIAPLLVVAELKAREGSARGVGLRIPDRIGEPGIAGKKVVALLGDVVPAIALMEADI